MLEFAIILKNYTEYSCIQTSHAYLPRLWLHAPPIFMVTKSREEKAAYCWAHSSWRETEGSSTMVLQEQRLAQEAPSCSPGCWVRRAAEVPAQCHPAGTWVPRSVRLEDSDLPNQRNTAGPKRHFFSSLARHSVDLKLKQLCLLLQTDKTRVLIWKK